MDSLEAGHEKAPGSGYSPTIIAGSEAEAQRLRGKLPPGIPIKIDRVGTSHPVDATSRIRPSDAESHQAQARIEEAGLDSRPSLAG